MATHGFFEILFSTQHYANPFGCPCGDANPNDYPDHSLTTAQKIAAFVIPAILAISLMLVAHPAFGLIAIPAFFLLTAFLKARNSVWTVYNANVCVDNHRFFMFIPDWWGFAGPRITVTLPRPIPPSPVFVNVPPIYPYRPPAHYHHHPHYANIPSRANPMTVGGNVIPGQDAWRRY